MNISTAKGNVISTLYRLAADVVVIVHLAYVAFVLIGFLLILVGIWRGWEWTRGYVFRVAHLTAIAIVVCEALFGMTCPLTTWEQQLRRLAGDATYRGDFIATWAHELLFFEAEPHVFTVIYSLFGIAVLITYLRWPPRRRKPDSESPHVG